MLKNDHYCYCGEYGNEYLLSVIPHKFIYLCDIHASEYGFCFICQESRYSLNDDGLCSFCEGGCEEQGTNKGDRK